MQDERKNERQETQEKKNMLKHIATMNMNMNTPSCVSYNIIV